MKKKNILILIIILLLFPLTSYLSIEVSSNPRIRILDQDENEIAYLNNEHLTTSISISMLSEKQIQFILAIEDKDFYKHKGFSISRMIQAGFHNLFHSQKQGASTITQQYIKNTYLTNSKTFSRKLKELVLAIRLENQLTKDEILEEYLSSIYFGNNVYGLSHAAKYYYSKEIIDLTHQEMISLIALWNAPTLYAKDIRAWNRKKDSLVTTLHHQGYLTDIEALDARKDIKLNLQKEYIPSNRLYYIDQVVLEFKEMKYKAKFNECISIYTKYRFITETIQSSESIDYSIISIDSNGYITTCIGNKDYQSSTYNIAMQGKRDIGSTIKPLLYYEALKCKMDNQVFHSSPFTFLYKKTPITITNSSSNYFNFISLRQALAVSDNIYAVKMHLALGMNTLVEHLKKYDIKTSPYPSLALGSVGMSLYQLSSIYFQFFKNGIYLHPRFIVRTSFLKQNETLKPSQQYLLNQTLCNQIKSLLSAPFDTSIPHATCSALTNQLKTTCYGKSGLTDYDSYLIGFNENHLTAVWCGDITNKELTNSSHKRLPKDLFVETMNCLT